MDVAWMTGHVWSTPSLATASQRLTMVSFLMIWENGDDGWQIALYSVSNNAPN